MERIAAARLPPGPEEDIALAEDQNVNIEPTDQSPRVEQDNQMERMQVLDQDELAELEEHVEESGDIVHAAMDVELDQIEPSDQAVAEQFANGESQISVRNNSPESITESTMIALNQYFPSAIPVNIRFSIFPPVIFSITQQSDFAVKEDIMQVLDDTWVLYQERVIGPVCYSDRTSPLAGFNNLDHQYVRKAVAMLVHICTSWKCLEDPSFSVAEVFYDHLKRYFSSRCENICHAIMKKQKLPMLELAATLTNKYFLDTKFMKSFFLVLDLTHVRSSGTLDIHTMLGHCYMSGVYESISESLHAVVASSLEKYRAGITGSYSRTITCYRELLRSIANGIDPFIQKDWNGFLVQNCFDHVFVYLETPHQHCLCHYVELLWKRVRELRDFAVGNNLVPRFLSLLRTLNHSLFFEAQLIPGQEHDQEIPSIPGVIHFLEERCFKALRCLLKIFRTEADFIGKIASTFEEHIQAKFIPDFQQRVGNNASPFEFFSIFMHTWIRVVPLSMSSHATQGGNTVVSDALENPFRHIVCQHSQLFTSQLELYFDNFLINAAFMERILPELSVEEESFTIVFMLRLLPRLERFLEGYTDKLVRLIPRVDIPPNKAEALLVPMIKAYAHMEEVEKLKGFLSVVTKKVKHSKAFSPGVFCKWVQPHRVPVFDAKAVRRFDWPEDSMIPMELPPSMRNTVEHYGQVMKRRHEDKTLVLNFSCDTIVVNTNVFSRTRRKTAFHMSTNQMCLLNLFQIVDSLTIDGVFEKIKPCREHQVEPMNRDEFNEKVLKCLRSLMTEQYPLLKKIPMTDVFQSQDIVSINSDFKTEERVIVLAVA